MDNVVFFFICQTIQKVRILTRNLYDFRRIFQKFFAYLSSSCIPLAVKSILKQYFMLVIYFIVNSRRASKSYMRHEVTVEQC